MSDLPKTISIHEEGPREGFQMEAGPIPTARKIEFIEALAEAGLAVQLLHLGLPDHFIDHGDPVRLLVQLGLDAEGIQRSIEHRLS